MDETELRSLIDGVRDGRLSRRNFIARMTAVGLTAPMAGMLLAQSGVAFAQAQPAYKPLKAGGGGSLQILLWQAVTLINPHFAIGTKDQEGARVFYEPLAGWDNEGNLFPILAAEVPSRANGGLSPDGTTVTWKLKRGVKWHDGKPFTAEDVIFNYEYVIDPATAAVTSGSYMNIEQIDKVDDHAVKVKFKQPTPFWADAFVGVVGMLIPKHVFEEYKGAKSREAPANLRPVGTGPYKYVDFKPGDMVRGERFADYHVPNQPYFDTIEIKGGGDAVSAARAVLQTGEFDYAWNMQVEDDILKRMETGGRGRVLAVPSGSIEFIVLNTTDPWTEIDGERSHAKSKHPTLSDPAVRQAINLLIDRDSIQKFIYGRGGTPTANIVNAPAQFRSPNMKYEFSIESANKVLDEAGWKPGSNGIREKDGNKLKFVFQTSINGPRQKTQAIIKQACGRAGIELELKSIAATVFFSSDVANPDTYAKFYCDMQMLTTSMLQPDPGRFLNQCLSWEIASKENKWQGRNISRFTSQEVDEAYRASQRELDPVKRAALFIRINDIFCSANVVLPLISRTRVAVAANNLVPNYSGWDSDLWQLGAWYRDA